MTDIQEIIMKNKILLAISLLAAAPTFAATYSLPAINDGVIGSLQYTSSNSNDKVVEIQKRYDVGYNALEHANPHLDFSRDEFPYSAPLTIPTQHLLPNRARVGIVINLPEMRMYYYPPGTNEVRTYPIGIGKVGRTIPIMNTMITKKVKNPEWIPTPDIREFNLRQGIVLPSVMPAGPDNPLGPYAIYMRLPTYLIHSTPFAESVGKRASFGCIRMFPQDIEDFFPSIQGGIPVAIINTPTKVGWQRERIYLEAYRPLEEHSQTSSLANMVHMINDASKEQPALIDWQQISYIAEEQDGVPHEVGVRLTNN